MVDMKAYLDERYGTAETTPDTQVAQQTTAEQPSVVSSQNKTDLSTLNLDELKQHYGIGNGRNGVSWDGLYNSIHNDNVNTALARQLQDEWIKNAQYQIDNTTDATVKAERQKKLDGWKKGRRYFKQSTGLIGAGNQVAEAYERNKDAAMAQVERAGDAITHRITMSDEEVLAKFNPKILEEAKKKGSFSHLISIGSAVANQEYDISGMGSTILLGTTDEERTFGKNLYDALQDARARETLDRTNTEGAEVEMLDGTKKKMSRMQAAAYWEGQASQISGNKELAAQFEENPMSTLFSLKGANYLIFNQAAGSTVRNAPMFVAGSAAMFVNPIAGMAIMNMGNLSDQEFSAVKDRIAEEYKKIHGENADVTSLSGAEYMAFAQQLADKGAISEASNEGLKTGALMTLAGTAMGGVGGKLSSIAVNKMSKEAAKKMSISYLAPALANAGLKVTDEGLQEVAETIVENLRNGKPWSEGLTQAMILGTVSMENVSTNVGKAYSSFRNRGNTPDQPSTSTTEQTQSNPSQLAEQETVNTGDDYDTRLAEAKAQVNTLLDIIQDETATEEQKAQASAQLETLAQNNADLADGELIGATMADRLSGEQPDNNSQESGATGADEAVPDQTQATEQGADQPTVTTDEDQANAEERTDTATESTVGGSDGTPATQETTNQAEQGVSDDITPTSEPTYTGSTASENADPATADTQEQVANDPEQGSEPLLLDEPSNQPVTETVETAPQPPKEVTSDIANMRERVIDEVINKADGALSLDEAYDMIDRMGNQPQAETLRAKLDAFAEVQNELESVLAQRAESQKGKRKLYERKMALLGRLNSVLDLNALRDSAENVMGVKNAKKNLISAIDSRIAELEGNNERRETNRPSKQNADGQTDGGNAQTTDTSGKESGNETGNQVSPTETETTTAGHNQSDTKPTSDPVEQPNDNSQESGATGADGRTGKPNSKRGKPRELGQDGSEQSGTATEATGNESTGSGVQQRTESDSSGETLNGQDLYDYATATLSKRIIQKDEVITKRLNEFSDALSNADFEQSLPRPREVIAKLADARRRMEDSGKRPEAVKAANTLIKKLSDYVASTEPGTPTADFSAETRTKEAQEAKKRLAEKHAERKNRWEREVERGNKVNSAINNIGSEQSLTQDPYGFHKETRTRDLQRIAHNALREDGANRSNIEQAFKDRVRQLKQDGSLPANSSPDTMFNVADRGYVQYSDKNPKHKEYGGSKVGLLGFDFDDKPVYETKQQDAFAEAEMEAMFDNSQDNIQLTLEQAYAVIGEEDPKAVREIKDAVSEEMDYLLEAGVAVSPEAVIANANESFISSLSEKAQKFFKQLQKMIYSLIAVVAVGSMTVPTDAHASQGFAQYTQGQTISGVSQEASNTINWVTANKDHRNQNFVVADKDKGVIHVVSPDGKVLNTQNALFGKDKGNNNVAGSTPSGRFYLKKTDTKTLTKADQQVFGDSVLDLTDANTGRPVRNQAGIIAMHRVVNKPERKQALTSATASDNYLSNGCINIPTAFYDSSVDTLDGSMVYILDHKDTKVAAKKESTRSQGLKVSGKTNLNTGTGLKVSGKTGLNVKSKLSVRPLNDFKSVETSLTETAVKKALRQSLGDLADNVTIISREEFGNHQGYETLNVKGIEGFYDPETDHVYMVADNLADTKSMKAAERVGFVAWHELTHRGLRTALGDKLNATLDRAYNNPTIKALADAILTERVANGVMSDTDTRLATEEAIAELNAAKQTGNFKELLDRYGVEVPKEIANNPSFFKRVYRNLKDVFNAVIGRKAGLSDNQLTNLLSDVTRVNEPADPATREEIAKVLNEFNNPDGVMTSAKLYSLMSGVNSVRTAIADRLNGKETVISEDAGKAPGQDNVGEITRDEKKGLGVTRYLERELTDSQTEVTDAMGGITSRGNLALKTFFAKLGQKQTEFNRGIMRWSNKAMGATKVARKRLGLYKGRAGRVAVYNDIQRVAVSRYAMTGGNAEVRQHIVDLLDGYTATLADGTQVQRPGLQQLHDQTLAGINAMGSHATKYQYDQLKRFADEIAENKERLRLFDERNNRIVNGTWDEATQTFKPHPSMNGVQFDIHDHDSDGTFLGQSMSREGMAQLGGYTTAEAYLDMTKLAESGLVDVTVNYNGTKMAWKDYIKAVGFTKENGFADVSKDYTIDPKDIEVTGILGEVVQDYVDLTRSHYDYMEQNHKGAYVPNRSSNPWAVPTSGKVDNIRSMKNKNGNYDTDGNQSVDEIVRLEEAAAWQKQRMGRSFTSNNALQQLAYTSSLANRIVATQDLGVEMAEMHKQNPKKVRKIAQSSPIFNKFDGVLIHEVDKNGNVHYYKLMWADNNLNEAMFLKNRTAYKSHFGITTALGWISRWQAFFMTGTPIWGLQNAHKGMMERINWAMSVLGEGDTAISQRYANNPKYQEFVNAIQSWGLKDEAAVTSLSTKIATRNIGPNTWNGAWQYALYKASPQNDIAEYYPSNPEARAMFDKVKRLDELGGLSMRTDMFSVKNNDILSMLPPETAFGKAVDPKNISKMQEKVMTVNMASEMLSAVSFHDMMMEIGMTEKDAAGMTLISMNFNDVGASKFSSFLRKVRPFVNATAQGSRGLAQVLSRKQGRKRFAKSVIKYAVAHVIANMIADAVDCPNFDDMSPFDAINSDRLMRDIPIYIGCSALRTPIPYGAGMIANALGGGFIQWVSNKWSGEQYVKHVVSALAENASPVPLGTMSSGLVNEVSRVILPSFASSVVMINNGVDDFGNSLLAFGVKPNDPYNYRKHKPNADPFWVGVAEFFGSTPNWNASQWEAFSEQFLGGGIRSSFSNAVDMIRGDEHKPEAERATFGKIIGGVLGVQSVYRFDQGEQKELLARTFNVKEKYSHFDAIIDHDTQFPTDLNGDGEVDENDGKISLTEDTRNKKNRQKIYEREAWVERVTKDFSPEEKIVFKALLKHRIDNLKVQREKTDYQTKNELYLNNNRELLRAIQKAEGKR